MLPLAHMVAASGTAWLTKRELGKHGTTGLFVQAFQRIDYRAVAFGSILPDLIDKPIVWFILRDGGFGGHHFGHSLLLSLPLLVMGIMVAARGQPCLLLVAFGALTHLFLDSLTHIPWSILYPLMDLDVPRSDIVVTAANGVADLAAIIALFVLLKSPDPGKRISAFLREGVIKR